MKKTLTFEGAGCVPVNDVENCRIRTAFINDQGKVIYLEIIAGCNGNMCVDFCFYLTGEHDDKTAMDGGDDCNKSKVIFKRRPIERSLDFHVKYTKANILAFVNRYCHCSFTDVEITNEFDDYHVYGGDHYNLMEGSAIDRELRNKRAEVVETL